MEWKFDISHWSMRQFLTFNKAVNEARYEDVASQLTSVVVESPVEGDIKNPDFYLDLPVKEWGAIMRSIGKDVAAEFSEGN